MARQMTDIALEQNEDLLIMNGDFVLKECTLQHQRQLILNNKGDFKQNPTICVGVFTYFDDEQTDALTRAVSIEFARDGMDVQQIRLNKDGVLESHAFYL
jgi:hypothetical protein